MARTKTTTPAQPSTSSTKPKPKALRDENIPYETDYYAASGAALLPSSWVLQMAFMSPNLDGKEGIVNTADVVVSMPWPLAKAFALALQQAVDQHDPTPLPKVIAEDIKKNGGVARSLVGTRNG